MQLAHGDLVHIGKAAFRFEFEHPMYIRKPEIVLLKNNHDTF
jgi:hypothetical protein